MSKLTAAQLSVIIQLAMYRVSDRLQSNHPAREAIREVANEVHKLTREAEDNS